MPMSGFRSPLDAYREDLSRAPGRRRLAAGDEFWIILATGLRRLAQAPPRSRPAAARRLATAIDAIAKDSERRTPLARSDRSAARPNGHPRLVAAALARFPQLDHAADLVTHVRGAVADAEEAGAVGLAREMLTDLRELSSHAPPLDQGMILLQLGRIARTLGDLDGAQDFFAATRDLGRQHYVEELAVRVDAAEAVVARTRGNYPAARTLFERARAGAERHRLVDVLGMAHHGLMIVTAEGGDFDTALRHGWNALSAARVQGAREAEMLVNLAELCAKMGYDAAALGALAAALARTTIPRLRLPALAGIVGAAGRVCDADRVAATEALIAAEASDRFPFETSRAWLAVARARRAIGDAGAADAAAEKAAVIARAHGFYEITHRLEQDARVTPAVLSTRGLELIRSFERWSDDPTADLVLSTSTD